MKNPFQIVLLLILLTPEFIHPQEVKNFYTIHDSISSREIFKHLQFLANDSLQGRGVGSVGEIIASEYIAIQFENYKLEKIPGLDDYFQNIPMHGSLPLSSSELTLVLDKDTSSLKYGKDYFLYRSGQQTFIPAPLPIVFVGYGIVAPEFDYNDYQSVDVAGKIVVYVDGEPFSDDEDYFNSLAPTVYSYSESKRRIAIARGAAGTIQISINQYEDWDAIKKDFYFEDVTLAYSVSSNLSIILNSKSADQLLINSGFTFKDIKLMIEQNRMKSFPLETKIKFKGVFKERDFISKNVIGLIKGSDPVLNDSYLLLSAHYDHLGVGTSVNGDSIYNGALDNAIGVSVLLELAKAISQLDIKPKRSIIFIATTGEEKGLLGASYYIDNPVVPLFKTIANINIDGIAMFKDFVGLVPIGANYSTLDLYLKQTANNYDLLIEEIPPQFRSFDAFNKSDQLAFAIGGIPSIFILEGLSNKSKSTEEVLNAFIDYYLNKYHTPFDDLNQTLEPEASVKHAKILFDFAYRLANQVEVPEWKSGAPFISARLRSIAEKK
ncbi:MAG: M28 family peptidase [Ignavibacteria bacterium]|nr:M28 family peptidase [Ignavibacteria bacterium]